MGGGEGGLEHYTHAWGKGGVKRYTHGGKEGDVESYTYARKEGLRTLRVLHMQGRRGWGR